MARCQSRGTCQAGTMPTLASLVGVFTVALIMVLTPGPNMMYLVSRTITQGRRAGVISLSGVALGFLVYLTATNLGLSAMFGAVPDLYIAVKLAGAVYLGWLAFTALRRGGASLFAPAELPADSPPKAIPDGAAHQSAESKDRNHVSLAHSAVRASGRGTLGSARVCSGEVSRSRSRSPSICSSCLLPHASRSFSRNAVAGCERSAF